MKDHMTVAEVANYLAALPPDLTVRTHLLEDNSFTVVVSPDGEAKTVRNKDGDIRTFLVFLPERRDLA